MFLLLKGTVAVSTHDGMGHVVPIVEEGPGEFLAEVGQLSGRAALVDARATGDVEALLIPPERLRGVIIAEAELGEKIMRALILRRVALIENGTGGPVLIGPALSPEMVRLQGFLSRNGYPHQTLDPDEDADAKALVERYAPDPSGLPLAVCADGTVLKRPSTTELARCLGMVSCDAADRIYDVAIVGAGPAGLATAVYAGLGRPVGHRVRCQRIWRTGRCQRPHRELFGISHRHFRPGADRPRLCAGAEIWRRGGHSRGSRGSVAQARRFP